MSKSKPKPRPRPTGPKRPTYRIAAALALALAVTPACGDEYIEEIEHGAVCVGLAAGIANHLLIDLGCTLQVDFLTDFGVACASGEPEVEDALRCLTAVYELTECPNFLPEECLVFTPRLQTTVPPGNRPDR